MFDILVAGAGLAGLTSARILAERGKKVLVVERRRHIGGNCYDYRNAHGITVHAHGPHIFHTNFRDVWDFVRRFSDFNYYQHRVLSYAQGVCYPFPINCDTLSMVMGKRIAVSEVAGILREEVAAAEFTDPPRNFRDAIVSQVGERLYEMFFAPYTEKQWGRSPELLSADVANRIPIRENRDDRYFSDTYQGIPGHGYTALMQRMADHENISILTGADYFSVRDIVSPELTIYTGELDRFFDYSYGKLEYRSLRFELKNYPVESYQDAAVVNYPKDYDWTRVTEFKKLSGEVSDMSTVCFEYPAAAGEPYYVVMTEENINKREAYLERITELEERGAFLFIGRLAEYRYYNMDQVIKRAMDRVGERF